MALRPIHTATIKQGLEAGRVKTLSNSTVEHLLRALTEEPSARSAMIALGVNLRKLRGALNEAIRVNDNAIDEALDRASDLRDKLLYQLDAVLWGARNYMGHLGRTTVTGTDLLLSIFKASESSACKLLVAQNVSRPDIVRYVSRNSRTPEDVVTYLPRIGELVEGVVTDIDEDATIVDLGNAQASLLHRLALPKEKFAVGDKVRAVLFLIQPEAEQPRLLLTRTASSVVAEFFKREVPEITRGTIEVKSIARIPGWRIKLAVKSLDQTINPVGACVGKEGARVSAVYNELGGERIDIVEYVDDPAQFATEALKPEQVDAVFVDPTEHCIYVAFNRDDATVFGHDALNVSMASDLTGWNIKVLSEAEAARYAENEVATTFLLGEWFVQPNQNQMRRGRKVVALGCKAVNVLAYLARHAPEVVESKDIIHRYWSRTDDGSNALYRLIANLRKALGDDAKNPRYIVTVPKRGYRINASVKLVAANNDSI